MNKKTKNRGEAIDEAKIDVGKLVFTYGKKEERTSALKGYTCVAEILLVFADRHTHKHKL